MAKKVVVHTTDPYVRAYGSNIAGGGSPAPPPTDDFMEMENSADLMLMENGVDLMITEG